MAEAEKPAESAPAPAASSGDSGGGGPSKLILIISLVNVLISLGVAGILFVQYKKDKAKELITDIDPHAKESHKEEGKDAHGGGHGAPAADHGGGGGHGAPAKEEKKEGPQNVALDLFTVNLYAPGGSQPKYVRANITLEVEKPEVEEEVKQKTARIRNVIIDLFNSKRASDLQTPAGREFVREEIRGAINQFLKEGTVTNVYFVSFSVTS